MEPSGCAGIAALLHNKIPNVDIKQNINPSGSRIKVVTLLSGGNVSPDELSNLFKQI